MGVISNGTTLLDAGALDSGVATGAMTLLSTVTASSSATVSFASGITSTYKEYIFKFYDVHPSADAADLTVNFRDGSSAYDATKTSSFFWAYHSEDDSDTTLNAASSNDLAQGTGVQPISSNPGYDNDQACSGTLHLFDPASTTFVKHFIAISNSTEPANYSINSYASGYCNVTAAIDGVQFKFESGNIDSGTFKMYGVK
jgi:hypothetical protein